jgi:hypothetical protein
VGLIGWAVIIGLMAMWEGLSLVNHRGEFDTFSSIVRYFQGPAAGRWGLFVGWVVLGFYVFVPR